ncbi:CD1247 N-terminal domain-containing protein [Pseudoflavonifractor sp.]|jgi:hypothetical protein|uniref:CD1247 N-terminal domain-containing protein n=1 Tax=Pseudoflavonifractor sp. TaxID=1980281 RepID=UPI003D8CC20E
MTISEKVAYLKGLAEGMKLDTEESKEGKLISVMIGILEEVGLSIEDMEDNMEAMGEEIDAISDDLSDVEKVVYDEDDEDEDDDEDECDCCGDDDFFEVECPNCGDSLVIDEAVLEAGTVECPNCKGKFVIDVGDCEDDDCGCGCGCDHDHDHGDEE